MALIQLGSIITGIKGSIGGTTFSAIRAGTVAKNRLSGKRLLTSSQSNALNTSQLITGAWNDLTNSQKVNFNDYALANTFYDRHGVVKVLTGFQWFKQLCWASYYFEGNFITSPPAYAIPIAIPLFTIDASTGLLVFTWSIPIDISNTYLFLYTSKPVKGNATYQRGAYRLTDVRSLDYSNSFDFTDAYNQAHNTNYSNILFGGSFNINVLAFVVNRTSWVSGIAGTSVGVSG